MIIWMIAILLFALFGLMGWTLGAIRLGVSLIGLLLASMLAVPLGHIMYPILGALSVKNPVLLWVLGPFVVFLLIVIATNVIGLAVHQKVDVYYKYKAGDLRMSLFQRLNARAGLGLGFLNAAIYLILISWVIYAFSYWTDQMAAGEGAPASVRMLNAAGQNLQSSGMAKVAAAVDRMPDSYYQAADVVGMIYHNDLLEGRLSRYPAFLSMGERPEFQDIANDKAFMELRQQQPPIGEIINQHQVQTILGNAQLLHEVWGLFTANLPDLQEYLKTGKSAKYDGEPIVGRWDFDVKGTLNDYKRLHPNIVFNEMQRAKAIIALSYPNTTLMATPDPEKMAVMKQFGKLRPITNPKLAPQVDFQNFRGTWSNDGGKYTFTFPDKGSSLEGTLDGDKLTLTGESYPLVFEKE